MYLQVYITYIPIAITSPRRGKKSVQGHIFGKNHFLIIKNNENKVQINQNAQICGKSRFYLERNSICRSTSSVPIGRT